MKVFKGWSAFWAWKVVIFLVGLHFIEMGLETNDIVACWIGLIGVGYLFYG